MTETAAFLTALPDRAVIAITGPDARSFLQRVITRGPEDLTPGQAQFSALLTPQGKVLADFVLFDDDDGGLFIDVPSSEAAGLLKRFTLYRLRADAQITLREDLDVAAANTSNGEELQTVGLAVAADPRHPELGLRAIVPKGGPCDEVKDYHHHRIALGVPEFGADYGSAQVFSTDVNHDLLGGVDYKKGCFVGQEVASRMHRKGGVRKRTIALSFDTAAPSAGTAVSAGDVEIGTLTSVSGSTALALARIDRLSRALDTGASVTAQDAPAKILTDLNTL